MHRRVPPRKKNLLHEERCQRLDKLGFVWDPHGEAWEEGFGHLKIFLEHEGHCSVPAQHKASNGYRLGGWVSVQRLSQDKLSVEQKARLDALGFDWNPHDTAWQDGLEHFRVFVSEHKHCCIPAQYKSQDGYKLGRWVANRRFKKDTLSAEQIGILDALGFDWDPTATQWEEGFERLQAYVREYKHCDVPQQYKTPDGYRLGGWVSEQRVNRDIRFPEQKARLDALGFDWDPRTGRWEEGFEHLQVYVREYKDCRVAHIYKSPDGYRLGWWVLKQRQSRDTLSAERKGRLVALGFDWDPLTTSLETGFEILETYVREHGHCHVPSNYKSKNGHPLGRWVGDRRELQDTLSAAKKDQLNSLGFIWNAREALWAEGFDHLRAYVNEVKNCRVPVQYRSADGYKLGQWVANQRQSRDKLTGERKAQLDALGFIWSVRQGRSP